MKVPKWRIIAAGVLLGLLGLPIFLFGLIIPFIGIPIFLIYESGVITITVLKLSGRNWKGEKEAI